MVSVLHESEIGMIVESSIVLANDGLKCETLTE